MRPEPVIPAEIIDLGMLAANGSDADWYRETSHCGGCGAEPAACGCAGQCGCAHLHPTDTTEETP